MSENLLNAYEPEMTYTVWYSTNIFMYCPAFFFWSWQP